MGRWTGAIVAGMLGLAGACRAPAPTPTEPPAPVAYSFTPSPLLELARSEREVPPVRRHWLRRRLNPSKPAPDDTQVDEDGIRRTVRVHPFRLATPEELARSALRDAESRRPRELHPSRFLVRARRVIAASGSARRQVRAALDARDEEVALCLVEELAARPDVIIRTPAALVVEDAMRTGPLLFELSIDLRAGEAPRLRAQPPVNDATRACLVSALTPRPGAPIGEARAELTAFSERALSMGGSPLNHRLANEAATLGWIELERGAFEDALAYFEDAHWLYHRPEYELLQAMALQRMGRPNMALTRYRRFVEARPHAPETDRLRTRIAHLEAQRE